jgi:hypothetical protein
VADEAHFLREEGLLPSLVSNAATIHHVAGDCDDFPHLSSTDTNSSVGRGLVGVFDDVANSRYLTGGVRLTDLLDGVCDGSFCCG